MTTFDAYLLTVWMKVLIAMPELLPRIASPGSPRTTSTPLPASAAMLVPRLDALETTFTFALSKKPPALA